MNREELKEKIKPHCHRPTTMNHAFIDDALNKVMSIVDEYTSELQKEIDRLKANQITISANEPVCNYNGSGGYCPKCGDISRCKDGYGK